MTYLSNNSPEVVPDARTHYSLLSEVSRSSHKPVNLGTVAEEALEGFVATRLLSAADLGGVVDTHLIVRECWADRILPQAKQDLGLLPEDSGTAAPPSARSLESAAAPA